MTRKRFCKPFAGKKSPIRCWCRRFASACFATSELDSTTRRRCAISVLQAATSGESWREKTRERLCADLYEAYASTDCGQITAIGQDDWETHGETVGKPIWCVLVRIAEEDGTSSWPRRRGRSLCSDAARNPGILSKPDSHRRILRGGWCHTGDIGFLDEEGYLHISGRKKNMVKSGGVSIFPEEIEDALGNIPA